MPELLRRVSAADALPKRGRAVDPQTLAAAAAIVNDVRDRGWAAVREHALRLGDAREDDPLTYSSENLQRAREALPRDQRALLEAAAERIFGFASAQRACLQDLELPCPGGVMGHRVAPVERAGCYAPGGRYPLPSSVLMTACTARAAGVPEVWVASPKPAPITLAAAAIAGADGLLAVGGAQAIAALAYGAGDIPGCDTVVGPGNRWVTAAKQLVAGTVAIDMLAGPSELLILADESADPRLVAADLLAQAEHDDDAVPMLVTTDVGLPAQVDAELQRRLASLPAAQTARNALRNGFVAIAETLEEAIACADRFAPEHLEIMMREALGVAERLRHYGAVFIGPAAAEVVGDYGIGPNHTLPTGGTARSFAGLSVMNFLRCRTFLRMNEADSKNEMKGLYRQTAEFARLEGLEAHARAAEARLNS